MSLQETLILVVGIAGCVVVMAALFITSFWAIIDCAQSKDFSQSVKIRWLVVLISCYAVFIPSFIYGRYIAKSRRLRAFTKVAFIALILSVITLFATMMTAKDFLSPITSGKNASAKTANK